MCCTRCFKGDSNYINININLYCYNTLYNGFTCIEICLFYDYYMCKYWFLGKPHPELKNWRQTVGSKFSENLEGSETFVVPLYYVASSEKLKEMVVDPLLKVAESQKKDV